MLGGSVVPTLIDGVHALRVGRMDISHDGSEV